MSQLLPFLHDQPLPPSRNDRSRIRRTMIALGALALVLAVVWAVVTVRAVLPTESVSIEPGTAVTIVIEPGDSLTAVGQRLVDAGVLLSVSSFIAGAALEEQSTRIGPGVYNLTAGLTPAEAVRALLDPASKEPPLVVREGLRLTEVLALIAANTGIAEADLAAAAGDAGQFDLPTWVPDRLDGVLFPASYPVFSQMTSTEVLGAMVDRFNIAANETELEAGSKRLQVTPYEVLTVASLVEAEAAPKDFRKVARVIYNRLAAGQRLELDSTINFALGTSTLIVTENMLATDSAYNTYRNAGLPPTPINSPGQAAIEAALKPAKGDWLYFVTVNPAERITRFTASYERFLEYKAQFQRVYAEQVAQGLIDPGPSAANPAQP